MIYTTDEINHFIEQYVHNAKYREILRLKLIDGYTFEETAEKMKMCDRQIKNIVKKYSRMFTEISL